MDLEKLLRSIPIARRSARFGFLIPLLMVGLAFAFYDAVILGYPVDGELIIVTLALSAFCLILAVIVIRLLFPTRNQASEALEKADYMYTCISKLDYNQQLEIEIEIKDLGTVWHSKTYLLSSIAAPPSFGKHCVYAKVVGKKTFPLNQHVILPYQNIAEVIKGRPASGKSEAVRIAGGALSVAGGVLSAVTGSGGVFTFTTRRPTIVVVDDADNTYQIDCTDANGFINRVSTAVHGEKQF